jgi:hypothetical protein
MFPVVHRWIFFALNMIRRVYTQRTFVLDEKVRYCERGVQVEDAVRTFLRTLERFIIKSLLGCL